MRGQNPQGTHRNVMRRAGQYGAGGRHGRANNGNPGRDAAASLGVHTVRLIYPQERSPLAVRRALYLLKCAAQPCPHFVVLEVP